MADTTWAAEESHVSGRVWFRNLDDPCSTQVEYTNTAIAISTPLIFDFTVQRVLSW